MFGAHRNTKFPKLIINLLHKRINAGANCTKIVLFQLLAFSGLTAKERSTSKD
ncbi:Uncharacterised protein [Chlamydia trachomatis]|nr:Uncharacterised protein [Chlamydia trachomatis]